MFYVLKFLRHSIDKKCCYLLITKSHKIPICALAFETFHSVDLKDNNVHNLIVVADMRCLANPTKFNSPKTQL